MRDYKKWAFLVGISKYLRSDFQNLPYAERYVNDFENILKESAEFEEIVVLRTKSEDEKNKIKGYDYTAPNTTNIQEKFDELLKKIGDHDLLIIYFLCHGGLLGGENCIFPENMSITSPETLKKAVIPLSDLEKPMRRLSPQTWNVFFFLDICQAIMEITMGGGRIPSNEEEFRSDIKPIEIDYKPSGISQFWACDSQHKAYTFKKGEDDHSIFSYALLKGLRKIPKPIKYGMLVNYVTKKVIKLAEGEGIIQVPQDVSKDRGKETVLIGDRQSSTNIFEKKSETLEGSLVSPKEGSLVFLKIKIINTIINAGNEILKEKESEIDNANQYLKYALEIQNLKTEFKKITKDPIRYMTNILMKKIEEAEDDNILEEIYQAMLKAIPTNSKSKTN